MNAEQLTKYFMILIPIVVASTLLTVPISVWMVTTLTYNKMLTLGMSLFGYVEWAVLAIAIMLLAKGKKWNVHPALKRLSTVVVVIFAVGFVVGMAVAVPAMMEGFELGMRGGTVDEEALTLRLFEENQSLFLATHVVTVVVRGVEGYFWLQARKALQASAD